ncbi:MAG: leucine zipper domain-containing protein [Gemmatimonadota bacterium]|nr:leucine zipper domain-containing protein [Gemmatimonadota bacterium]
MSALRARYGVSRRIGYVWLARYEADGRRGLVDRSHAPHHCPHKIRPAVADLLIAERAAHLFWGARKLLAVLARHHPRITTGPRRARSRICWRATVWCTGGGGGGRRFTPAWSGS